VYKIIQIPYDQIIEKIKTSTNISDTDIQAKIDDKLKQLSGLISKEGAAHIIANQLGVKLIEKTSGRLEIKNILSGMRDVETVGKIQAVYDIKEFTTTRGSGKVGSFMLGDETGVIRVVCWGSKAEEITNLQPTMIAKISNGYVKNNNNRLEVHLNDKSTITPNPEGETIGTVPEQTRTYSRKQVAQLSKEDVNSELVGTIVQVYDPHFFEICPTCNKRAKPENDQYVCQQHGAVTPTYSYVLNAFLDDGTGNIRITCFRNQATNLVGKTHEEFLTYRENPTTFEAVKTELLGNIVKFQGRVNHNEQFDRIEFVAELVHKDVNPEDELKKLQEQPAPAVAPLPETPATPEPAPTPEVTPEPAPTQEPTPTPVQEPTPPPAQTPEPVTPPVETPTEIPPEEQKQPEQEVIEENAS
jgi:replication factor A1